MSRDRTLPIPTLVMLGVVVVLAAGLRVPKLATRTFWFDEVFQVHVAGAPNLSEMNARVMDEERTPPLGFVLTRAGLWLAHDELGARLPSIVCGVLCVPLGWLAARLWSRPAAAWWVAWFTALAPAYVFYSREARVYAPGIAVIFALMAATGWFRLRPHIWSGTVFVAATLAAASMQYAGAVVTGIWLAAAWLAAPSTTLERARFRRGWWAAAALSVVVVAWWAVQFMLPQVRLRGTGSSDAPFQTFFWDPTSIGSVLTFLKGPVPMFIQFPFLAGETGPRWKLLAVLAAAPAAVPIALAARPNADPTIRTMVVFEVLSLAVFIALAGLGKHPFGGIRHCLPLTPGFLLLVGTGLAYVARLSWPLSVGWGLLALALMCYGTKHTGWNKHDHGLKALAADVAEHGQPGDPVIIVGGAVTSCKYYESVLPWPGAVSYCGSYLANPPEREFNATFSESLLAHGRVWVVEFPPFDRDFERQMENKAVIHEVLRESLVRATLFLVAQQHR